MPTLSRCSDVLGCHQICDLHQLCAAIESIPASPAIRAIGWVNILEVLSLILEYARILEVSAVFQSRNVAAENAGSASLQTTHKNILIVFAVIFHRRIFFHGVPF